MVAGFQVPVMPFNEMVGKEGPEEFWQYGPKALNMGARFGFTTIVREAVVAHWPASGVKV